MLDRRLLGSVALCLAPGLIGCAPAAEQEPFVVFLVRHAEKVVGEEDPDLTSAGRERAETLAGLLQSAELDSVLSSDYKRTRQTAAPVARACGLEVELYDPRDLPSLVARLREEGGRHLIVGHSNTTPHLAGLLGGDPGSEVDEKTEYDRLYIVTSGKDGSVNTALLRYGKPYEPL